MKNHEPTSIPCALGRLAPKSPANADEMMAMRAAAWHKQGVVVVPLGEIFDEWERAFLTSIATRLYGARTAASRKSAPWAKGDVVERGDGETWTVVAATAKSVTVQRSRDGVTETIGQIGGGRP